MLSPDRRICFHIGSSAWWRHQTVMGMRLFCHGQMPLIHCRRIIIMLYSLKINLFPVILLVSELFDPSTYGDFSLFWNIISPPNRGFHLHKIPKPTSRRGRAKRSNRHPEVSLHWKGFNFAIILFSKASCANFTSYKSYSISKNHTVHLCVMFLLRFSIRSVPLVLAGPVIKTHTHVLISDRIGKRYRTLTEKSRELLPNRRWFKANEDPSMAAITQRNIGDICKEQMAIMGVA